MFSRKNRSRKVDVFHPNLEFLSRLQESIAAIVSFTWSKSEEGKQTLPYCQRQSGGATGRRSVGPSNRRQIRNNNQHGEGKGGKAGNLETTNIKERETKNKTAAVVVFVVVFAAGRVRDWVASCGLYAVSEVK